MKTTLTLFLACTLLLVQSASAQNDNKAGTISGAVPEDRCGGTCGGMGEAMVSSCRILRPCTGIRPVLLGSDRSLPVFPHTRWFADITHQYFGCRVAGGEDHRFGINATILNLGEMEVTTEQDPQGTGDFFKASDVAVGVSATRPALWTSSPLVSRSNMWCRASTTNLRRRSRWTSGRR